MTLPLAIGGVIGLKSPTVLFSASPTSNGDEPHPSITAIVRSMGPGSMNETERANLRRARYYAAPAIIFLILYSFLPHKVF